MPYTIRLVKSSNSLEAHEDVVDTCLVFWYERFVMASVNKVILIGNLGRDPETRYTADGNTAICHIVVATSRRYKDSQGQPQEETEWHRVVFFGRQAEIAQQYLKKGNPAYIEGRLRTRKYTDKEGIERYQTEIICETLQLLGSRSQSSGASSDSFESPRREFRQAQPASRPAPQSAPQPQPAAQPTVDTLEEDDVPF